jgi:hypothetical protein
MANIGFDHFNKYILHDETDTSITVQELYNAAVDEMDFPHIAMTTGLILTATGKDALGAGEFTGVTLVLRNGWTFKSRTSPVADTTIKLSGGNVIAEGTNPRFTHVDKVHYEFAQSTSPALIVTAGVITPTQQQIRDSLTLNRTLGVLAGSVDDKLDNMLILSSNDQEWVSPGLLKIYDASGKVGGTTVYEFETRDSGGVQTFVIADVKQFIRVKP